MVCLLVVEISTGSHRQYELSERKTPKESGKADWEPCWRGKMTVTTRSEMWIRTGFGGDGGFGSFRGKQHHDPVPLNSQGPRKNSEPRRSESRINAHEESIGVGVLRLVTGWIGCGRR
jgi:hypothetical protein